MLAFIERVTTHHDDRPLLNRELGLHLQLPQRRPEFVEVGERVERKAVVERCRESRGALGPERRERRPFPLGETGAGRPTVRSFARERVHGRQATVPARHPPAGIGAYLICLLGPLPMSMGGPGAARP